MTPPSVSEYPPLVELGRTLAFFTSVIKSGEPWTATCQRDYDRANLALQALGHLPAGSDAVKDARVAAEEIWQAWASFYSAHFRNPSIGLSMADQQAFYEIAQPILTAALSAQPVQGEVEPVAKVLEWEFVDETWEQANTLFGLTYVATDRGWYSTVSCFTACSGLQHSKAAAQADFERRARSCLAPPSTPPAANVQDDVENTARALESWAPMVASGYEVPAAGQVMLNAARLLRSKQAPTVAGPFRDVEIEETAQEIFFGLRHLLEEYPREPICKAIEKVLRARAEQRETPSAVVGEGLVRIGTWRNAPNGNNWFDLKRQYRELDWPADTAIYAAAPTSDGR